MAKLKRKKKSKQASPDEPRFENDPTPERVRQAGGIETDFKSDTGRKNKRMGDVLTYLLNIGRIDQFQHSAGMTVMGYWDKAGFNGIAAIDYGRAKVDGGEHDPMQVRIDNAKKYGAAAKAVGHTAAKAFSEMVLRDMRAIDYGRTYLGYRDRATASRKANDLLCEALRGFDIHLTGGKRPNNAKTRAHMVEGVRPMHMPETHTEEVT